MRAAAACAPAPSHDVVDLALRGLREERSACVRRLEAMLASSGNATEVQGYLRRIANINDALVRLAGSHVVVH